MIPKSGNRFSEKIMRKSYANLSTCWPRPGGGGGAGFSVAA